MNRLWRRALVAWTVAVVVGGGLTLWLRDSGDAREPGVTPTPSLRQDAAACPTPTDSRYDDPRRIVVCVKDG
ncbi:hypothetical protein [Streptomyces sp. NPDC005538]|uniref:hypothetical protein n=1 Tax=unclassified Streptomyces TaxID=2593676 RepID=UPI0033BBB5E4